MATDAYVERLRAVPLFADLSKKELGQLLRHADHLRFGPGHVVVAEGKPGEEFCLVFAGRLVVRRGGADLDELGPGDFFGELAVIDPAPRDASVVSLTDVDLMVVERRRFWALVEEVPPVGRKVMVGLARRLREADLHAPARA